MRSNKVTAIARKSRRSMRMLRSATEYLWTTGGKSVLCEAQTEYFKTRDGLVYAWRSGSSYPGSRNDMNDSNWERITLGHMSSTWAREKLRSDQDSQITKLNCRGKPLAVCR